MDGTRLSVGVLPCSVAASRSSCMYVCGRCSTHSGHVSELRSNVLDLAVELWRDFRVDIRVDV